DWTVNMITRDREGSLYCVGTAGNVGRWDASKLTWNEEFTSKWTLNIIAWEPRTDGKIYCVGTSGNVGTWNGNGWDDQGRLGGWDLKMLTFDPQGTMWGVGTSGNIGKWVNGKWEDYGKHDKWELKMLTFDHDGNVWAVGTGQNIGYSPAPFPRNGWTDVGHPHIKWDLTWIYLA
ncbi:MAG TPA: hypothetical protein VIJ02_09650, partial [Thermoanaerobaculia bacterium]